MDIIAEVDTIFNSISEFYGDQSDYLISGGTLPLLADINSLEYIELLSYVNNASQYSSGFEIGSAQEAIYTAVALSRELDMATNRKTSIYNSITAELEREKTFYSESGVFFSGVVGGSSTGGSRS